MRVWSVLLCIVTASFFFCLFPANSSSQAESQDVCARTESLAGVPYAPKAEVRKGGEFADMWQMNISNLQVPDQNAVCAPAYPGAAVVSNLGLGDMGLRGPLQKSGQITLISSDNQEKIVAFYLDKLKGWHHESAKGMFDLKEDYFWTGGDDTYSIALHTDSERPVVIIKQHNREELGFMYGDLLPEANTTIEIHYPVK